MKGTRTLKLAANVPENGWLEFGILVSFWDGLFSETMLVLESVHFVFLARLQLNLDSDRSFIFIFDRRMLL